VAGLTELYIMLNASFNCWH